ncbi:phosphotransferase [Microcella daejeonensis]|uniref:phosphotransferase n=1 Tax=Microcella daejeonensis TaxID=2994971 RepID=UPI00227211D5|nr:phosphotransferase [Microcella daejeonensis]WAB85148.1 phosphotransferase [Microcella daejeonensis]
MLRRLRGDGVIGLPDFHGFDGQGREVLDFLPGEVGNYPLSSAIRSERALVSAARLVRRFHDATAPFAPAMLEGWQFGALEPVEVVCHGDLAPYNCVFDGSRAVGMIDFDTCRPGPRAWDLAYALYRFAPVAGPDNPDRFGDPSTQVVRAHRFLDAYGATPAQRAATMGMLEPRVRALIDHIEESAARGSETARRHAADGHLDIYRADIDHIRRMMPALGAPHEVTESAAPAAS